MVVLGFLAVRLPGGRSSPAADIRCPHTAVTGSLPPQRQPLLDIERCPLHPHRAARRAAPTCGRAGRYGAGRPRRGVAAAVSFRSRYLSTLLSTTTVCLPEEY
eukprot:129311-Pleurochrysis_carterae.AAC.2